MSLYSRAGRLARVPIFFAVAAFVVYLFKMLPGQKALWLLSKQGSFKVGPKAVQRPAKGELLVKLQSAALNPIDEKIWKLGVLYNDFPAVLGVDGAGIVEELGPETTGFAKGDHVFVHGAFNNDRSTFQQYTLVPYDITAKIPANISFDQAATIPLGLATAAVGLFHSKPSGLALTKPWTTEGRGVYAGKPFFVSGGSSSVGQYALQLAKLAGFSPIITTASLHNEQLLRSLGADHVVDRHLPAADVVAKAKALAVQPVTAAYDAVSQKETQQVTYDILGPGGGMVITLPKALREESAKGVEVVQVGGMIGTPTNKPLGVSLYSKLSELVSDGLIKPNRVEVLPGGLNGIVAGLERLAAGKVSGEKLVVHPQEE